MALATPLAVSAIGILRVSGRGVLGLVGSLVVGKTGGKLTCIENRKMVYASVKDPDSGDIVDDVMVCFYEGPSTFTGEDMVEIFPHGSPYVTSRILQLLIKAGCRQADPGEFSRRAFLNGKMDLAAAEGVRGMTEAVSEGQWLAAREMASGRLSRHVLSLREELIKSMAFLEARIDFPDEGDTQDVGLSQVRELVEKVAVRLERLLSGFQSGRVAAEGYCVALVGAPNVGKSTLLNAFLGEQRAIVTDVAGTTRDYLEERCLLNGRLVRLVDTAGLRVSGDVVEKIGIERSLEIAKKADLVLLLQDQEDLGSEVEAAVAALPQEKLLRVWTKWDLPGVREKVPSGALAVSARHGEGLEALRGALVERVDGALASVYDEGQVVMSDGRHQAAVALAKKCLEAFFGAFESGLYDECLAFELRGAAEALHSIVGRVDQDDVFDVIFSSFCVGK